MDNPSPLLVRCGWAATAHSIAYHDHEWGTPLHNERTLFEFVVLEGAQAGLSWETILRKRDAYRAAFDSFQPQIVAGYSADKIAELLANPGIVRNRLKIASAIRNAQAFLKVQAEFGSYDAYIWHFTGGKPLVNTWKSLAEIPARTPLSDTISKDLIGRGFNFVGSTIVYAFMQAVGIVNDHTVDCFRYAELTR